MNDSHDPADASGAPAGPDFTPVPVRSREDGWTPERQRRFIAEMHRTRSVTRACRAAGMTRESVYRLRERAGAESFGAAWRAAYARRDFAPRPAARAEGSFFAYGS